MDRRTFNKGVGAFFGALALPGGLKAVGSVSESTPVFVANNMEMTTTFELPQVFTFPAIEIYENIEEKPDVDVDVSFWLDEDHKIERKVYFKGDNKTWSESASDRELVISVDQSNAINLLRSCVTSYKENDYWARGLGNFGSFKTFEPGTENRIPLNELRLDAFYDITVTYDSDYIISLKNFKVTNIEDFNAV